MNTRLFLLSLLILALLFGCVSATSKIAKRAKTELVGISKTDILSCAGVPVRSDKSGNLEFLAYIGGSDNLEQEGQHGHVYKDSRQCEVTFVFKDDNVTNIVYTDQTGGWSSTDEQCAFAVEKCLSN